MRSDQKAPAALQVVAWLFILGGVCAVIEVVVSLLCGRVNINFGVLGLFIGPGLLRFSQGWRTCALVFIWLGLVVTPVAALLMLAGVRPIDFTLFGLKFGQVPLPIALVFAAVCFVLLVWEYHVLTRPDVRRLFGLGSF